MCEYVFMFVIVCDCICIHVYDSVCMCHVCEHVCDCICAYPCMWLCMYTCSCANVYSGVWLYRHMCSCIWTWIHVCDCMYGCIYTCVMFVILGVYLPCYMCGGSRTTLGAGPPCTWFVSICTQASWPASFQDFPVSTSFPSPCRNARFIDAYLNHFLFTAKEGEFLLSPTPWRWERGSPTTLKLTLIVN